MRWSKDTTNEQDELLDAPFCRGDELADIISAIRSEGTRTVFLTSDSGLGASTILRELAAAAKDHVPVLFIHGSKSLAKIPYGVIAPYLSLVGPANASARMAALRAILAELGRLQEAIRPDGQSAQDRPMIIIDDAQSTDSATAELVVSLVQSGMVNLVASHSSRHALPDPLPKLWDTGMAENIVLLPLDQEQAHAYCESLLGGAVLPASGWHFWYNSGGNPLFLRLLVTQAMEQGFLAKRRGIWVVDPNAPIHSHGLEEAVRRQLRGISGKGLEALNLIALSEPVADSTIGELVGPDAVRELLDWHLVRYPSAPSQMLGLANPIYGEVIRDMVPVTQSHQLHERLIGTLGADPFNKEALLRRVVWAVAIGINVPDERLLSAAVLAGKMFQSTTALELANQIQGKDYRLRAAMVKARARYNLGDYPGALSIMESAYEEAGNPVELLFGTLLRAATRSALGMPVASLVEDAAALRRSGRTLGSENPVEAASIQALGECGAVLVEHMALSRQGRYSEMTGLTTLLAATGGLSEAAVSLNLALALTLESERLSAQGFPQQGMARAAEAYAMVHSEENEVFFLPETILFRHLAAALCCGAWQEVAKVMEEFSLDTGAFLFSFGGGANVVRGMAFLRRGMVADALEVLLAGMDALRISDPQQLLGFCTAMAAYASARLGKSELARQLVDGHEEGTGMYVVLSHERAYMAGARYLLRNDAGVPAELVALADAALAGRSATLELNALAVALELGDESIVARLGRVAAGVEGPWAHALCEYARALENTDGAKLAAAGETLGAAGLYGFAEQALNRAVDVLGRTGSRDEARSARASLLAVVEKLGGQAGGRELAPVEAVNPQQQAAARLTRREREIAALASTGQTDRQIAKALNLSLRTVEGHLYRAYAKLDISSREYLAAALAESTG